MKVILLLSVALTLTACQPDAATPPADGPLTVEEALAADADQEVTVRGFLFVADDRLPQLCDMMLESFPPQCGGASVEVEGLAVGDHPLQTDDETGLQWSDGLVDVTGRISDGVLIASR